MPCNLTFWQLYILIFRYTIYMYNMLYTIKQTIQCTIQRTTQHTIQCIIKRTIHRNKHYTIHTLQCAMQSIIRRTIHYTTHYAIHFSLHTIYTHSTNTQHYHAILRNTIQYMAIWPSIYAAFGCWTLVHNLWKNIARIANAVQCHN